MPMLQWHYAVIHVQWYDYPIKRRTIQRDEIVVQMPMLLGSQHLPTWIIVLMYPPYGYGLHYIELMIHQMVALMMNMDMTMMMPPRTMHWVECGQWQHVVMPHAYHHHQV
jgi:hypothetical protein